jgi:hypothetical protein
MDEWRFNLLLSMLGMHFNSATQTCKAETKNGNSKKQTFCSDVPKNEKELIYGIGPNSVPYGKVLKLTTYTEIQEGEFTEIEDTETGEASVGELADQASDRREEILSDEADKG